jgi:HK97 family phage major capsid protein
MDNVLESKEYIDAYADYIKTGDDRECRSLLTTEVSGVVPVPVIVDQIVRTAWDNDQILSRVRKTYIKGNLKVTFKRSATEAVIHTEGTSAPSEEELLLGIETMIPRNIKKWITISDEAVAMGGEVFIRYIQICDEAYPEVMKALWG